MWGTQDLSAVLPRGGSGLLSSLADLRAALSLTQNTRLLQLETALPSGALVPERCTVREALHAEHPFLTELDCVSTLDALSLGALMGTPAVLSLQLSDGSWRQWHGHVARAAHLGGDGGLSRYRLQLRDFTHWASLRCKVRRATGGCCAARMASMPKPSGCAVNSANKARQACGWRGCGMGSVPGDGESRHFKWRDSGAIRRMRAMLNPAAPPP